MPDLLPDEYLAAVATAALRVRYPATQTSHTAPLVHLLYELARTPSGNPKGLVIFTPGTTLADATWHAVSQQVLTDLNYPSFAAYAAAAVAPGFVRAEDAEEVASHIDPLAPSPGIYDPWILRGNGTGYREMRVQGLNLTLPGVDGQLRFSLLWRP